MRLPRRGVPMILKAKREPHGEIGGQACRQFWVPLDVHARRLSWRHTELEEADTYIQNDARNDIQNGSGGSDAAIA